MKLKCTVPVQPNPGAESPACGNRWNVGWEVCYKFRTFNENLHEHISDDLADDVGRESDTP